MEGDWSVSAVHYPEPTVIGAELTSYQRPANRRAEKRPSVPQEEKTAFGIRLQASTYFKQRAVYYRIRNHVFLVCFTNNNGRAARRL